MATDVWIVRTDKGLMYADDDSRNWFLKKPLKWGCG